MTGGGGKHSLNYSECTDILPTLSHYKSFKVCRKSSENCQKRRHSMLCNKQNTTCPLVDTNFISSCSTLEDKIRIHARACNILYFCCAFTFCQPMKKNSNSLVRLELLVNDILRRVALGRRMVQYLLDTEKFAFHCVLT